jgi:hypothetical protein
MAVRVGVMEDIGLDDDNGDPVGVAGAQPAANPPMISTSPVEISRRR